MYRCVPAICDADYLALGSMAVSSVPAGSGLSRRLVRERPTPPIDTHGLPIVDRGALGAGSVVSTVKAGRPGAGFYLVG